MTLVYSEQAVADLVRLRDFIAEKDPVAASRIAEQLIERIEKLQVFPLMGSSVSNAPIQETVRDMVFGNYVVRYTARTQTLIVLRVWHHFEDR